MFIEIAKVIEDINHQPGQRHIYRSEVTGLTWDTEIMSWLEHKLCTNNDKLILYLFFVEKFNFLIDKLLISRLQSHCVFCIAEMIIKIVKTHIDEWQPWDLPNNERLVRILCCPIQSIIRNKTNNSSSCSVWKHCSSLTQTLQQPLEINDNVDRISSERS